MITTLPGRGRSAKAYLPAADLLTAGDRSLVAAELPPPAPAQLVILFGGLRLADADRRR